MNPGKSGIFYFYKMIKNTFKDRPKRVYKKLEIGEFYILQWSNSHYSYLCQFIQTTPKGYNFLVKKDSKCLLKSTMFKSNKPEFKSGTYFFVNENLNIIPLKGLSNEIT